MAPVFRYCSEVRTLFCALSLALVANGCARFAAAPFTAGRTPPAPEALAQPAENTASDSDAAADADSDANGHAGADAPPPLVDDARAVAAMTWLLRTVPQDADPAQWKSVRDMALDWIEAHEADEPRYQVNDAIAQPVIMDSRYPLSRYMRMAYQCGKARFVSNHPKGTPIDDEVAGIEGMFELYAHLHAVDERKSPKLERYWRKYNGGKLRAWIETNLAKGA